MTFPELLILILGIIVVVDVVLITDRFLTPMCPNDDLILYKIDKNTYKCGQCRFVKEVKSGLRD